MGIDYRRPDRQQEHPHQVPGQQQSGAAQPDSGGLRPDISNALASVPPHIRGHLDGDGAAALALLYRHLAPTESVEMISSVSVKKDGPPNSVLAITDHRLIFVAPAPQAVAWRLSSLTKIQVFGGYFFIHGDAGEYSLGLPADQWGATVERHVNYASTIAVLAGR